MIRPAAASDVEELVDLHLAFPADVPLPPGEPLSRSFYRNKMQLFLEAEPEGVLVAERGGAVSGALVVVSRPARLRQTALRRGFVLRAAVQALAGGYGPSPAEGLLPAGGSAVRKLFLAGRSLFRRGAGRAGRATRMRGAKVWVLLVHPEHRRQGVATALLRAAERYLRGRGAREVTVTVTEDNRPAQTLYEKAGFREAGRCLESSGPSLVLVKQLTEYQVVLVSGPEGLDLPETEQLPGQVVVARHLRRDLSPVHDALAVVELAGAFRRFGVDLVHTHTSKAGVLGRLAARLAGVRAVVHTPHGHIYAPEAHIQSVPRCATLRAGFLWSERLAGRWTTLLTTLTAAEARETVALGLGPADRVVPVPNGIEAEDFAREPAIERLRELRRELQLPARAKVVISVGRLTPEKGHRVLVEAAAAMMSPPTGKRPARALHLLLVGEGPERSALGALVRRLGVSEKVHFAGRREPKEVAALLHLADVFVLPSYYEGFGVALLEAQAAGVPIVATDVGGVREVLAGGRTGLLVPPGDAAALAEAMGKVLTDRDLAGRLAREGREWVVREFPVGRTVERYQAV